MIVAAVCMSQAAIALDVPPAPSLAVPIVDTTSTLTSEQISKLAEQIQASREQKSYQIGVLMISTLEGQVLEEYSLDVARQWGIGDSTNNGVLLIIAKDDRVLRIEVGRGLEGDLTDTRAKKIITTVIGPKFKTNDYYGGISEGVESIQLAVAKQVDPAMTADLSDISDIPAEAIATVFFVAGSVLMWLAAMLARSKGWWAGGVIGGVVGGVVVLMTQVHFFAIITTIILVILGFIFDFLVSRNYRQHKAKGTLPSWWAGGGTIGGGGGIGGGSFGGGGFSGGGSSGSW